MSLLVLLWGANLMTAQVLDAAQAQAVASRELERAAKGKLDLQLTPPFPEHWPPAGGGVVYCAYRTEALPTGEDRWAVYTPELEIHFVPTAAGKDAVKIQRLTERKLERSESREPKQEPSELEAAAHALFLLVTGHGSADDRQRLHAAHRLWLDEHRVLAGALEQRFPDYVRWLRSATP
jgi:hypothetical protein